MFSQKQDTARTLFGRIKFFWSKTFNVLQYNGHMEIHSAPLPPES